MVRNGLRGRTQRYKCNDCGRRFDGGIRRDLEGMGYVHKIAKYKEVTIQMDTTYWGRNFGLMVISDALRGVALWHKYVTHETIAYYIEGIETY